MCIIALLSRTIALHKSLAHFRFFELADGSVGLIERHIARLIVIISHLIYHFSRWATSLVDIISILSESRVLELWSFVFLNHLFGTWLTYYTHRLVHWRRLALHLRYTHVLILVRMHHHLWVRVHLRHWVILIIHLVRLRITLLNWHLKIV